MDKDILVSVIIPVYNTEQYLERCLNSLLSQTYRNLQIIIVNDASPGNAKEIIERYQDIDDRIIYTEHIQNMGLFKARITGSLLATGDYISFVDSDDYIGIDFYRLLVDEAERNQSDIALGRTVMVEHEKTVFGFHDIAFPDETLEGESIFKAFLEQEGRCYSWHTIWNKLYKKSLWDTCLPFYKEQKEHLVMMEDIAFSFPLFFFARKMTKVENSVYYYCQNSGSTTDSKSASFKKLEKNIIDMLRAFDFIRDFLKKVNANDWIMEKYINYCNYYIREWTRGIDLVDNSEERQKLKDLLSPYSISAGQYTEDDRFFRIVRTIWNDELEEIKKRILNPQYEYISFDIFDTLIKRPFYRPTDLFYLLDGLYETMYRTITSFHEIRIDGEIAARAKLQKQYPDCQDITIDEIYECISEIFGIPDRLCNALKEEEKKLEIQFCSVRKTVKELYDLALYAGKKIILISDMYLDKATVEKILSKNGYEHYLKIYLSSERRKLKHTGDLYRVVLDDMGIDGNKILHIGDNHYCDVIKASEAGLDTIYIPRTIHVFENRVKGLDTGELSTLAYSVGGPIFDRTKAMESIGYGAMIAMAANFYFDNPFRPFNDESDFNSDPYFIGYYAVGMHLAGLLKWIMQQAAGYKRILFLARDGYLVKQAYDIWTECLSHAPGSEYIYISRKMVLPALIDSPADFLNLPVVYTQYTPLSIISLLDFCTKDMKAEAVSAVFSELGIRGDKKFESKYEYQEFIRLYLDHLYDKRKHTEAKERLKKYYNEIKRTDIAFDMGYSGNIQSALVRASGKPVDVMFVHNDAVRSMQLCRKFNFSIDTFYDFSPAVTGLLREHILSGPHPACTGLQQSERKILPVFESTNTPYTSTFVLGKIHKGALDFIREFRCNFADYMDFITYKSYEVSLPFEAFLRMPKGKDIQVFEGSYFEDNVYGRQDAINISSFMQNQYRILPQFANEKIIALYKAHLIDSLKYKRQLVYFGTGKKCREVLAQYPDMPVSFFLDNNKKLSGSCLNGKEIKHPDQIDNWNRIYIIITTYYSSEIEKQLRNLGLEKYKDFISFQELFKIT